MAFVITRLCQDCVDGACVDHCPVDAIVEHRPGGGASELPNQLFIDPVACICCNACTPECPWEAIYEEDDVPSAFVSDIALNRRAAEKSAEYHVPVQRLLRGSSADEVIRNREKWAEVATGPAPIAEAPARA